MFCSHLLKTFNGISHLMGVVVYYQFEANCTSFASNCVFIVIQELVGAFLLQVL